MRTIPQEGKPDRREHSITDAGLAELDSWLAAPVEYVPSREVFLVRLFFVGRLGTDRVRAVLEERAAEARELAAVLEQTREASEQALAAAGITPTSRCGSASPPSPTGSCTRAASSSGPRTCLPS